MSEKVDVVVIGMGPGGEDAAGKLTEAGLKVVGIETELVGAECPYWGCIPSKMELAVKESIPVDRLRHLIYAYPTFYRGTGEAARLLPTGVVAQKAAVS
jgi:thioredoxin reductase